MPIKCSLGTAAGYLLFMLTAALLLTSSYSAGQICTAHTRLIVHKSIEGALLARLKTALAALPFLDDSIAETRIGDMAGRKSPLVTKNLLEDTDGLRRPLERGATQSISVLSMR